MAFATTSYRTVLYSARESNYSKSWPKCPIEDAWTTLPCREATARMSIVMPLAGAELSKPPQCTVQCTHDLFDRKKPSSVSWPTLPTFLRLRTRRGWKPMGRLEDADDGDMTVIVSTVAATEDGGASLSSM